MAYLAFDENGAVQQSAMTDRAADDRLLRRLAVLSWHDLVAVPAQEIAAFLAAGFTNAHYQTLRASIRAATINKAQRA